MTATDGRWIAFTRIPDEALEGRFKPASVMQLWLGRPDGCRLHQVAQLAGGGRARAGRPTAASWPS